MGTNKQTLKLYWQEMRHHKLSFFSMLIFIPMGSLLIDTILPYFLSRAIADISSPNSTELYSLLAIAGGVGLLGALVNFIGFQSVAHHEAQVIAGLRESVFDRLINKDAAFFSNQKIGSMTSRYIDFIRSHMTIQNLFIIRTLGFVLSVGIGVGLIARESLLVAAIILGLIVILVLEIRWSARKRAPWRHERKQLVSEIHGTVADSLTNNLIVKTFAAETREIRTLKTYTDRFRHLYRKDIGFVLAEGSVRVALMSIVQVIAVIVAATLVARGELSLATTIFLLAYLQRIGSQIFVLSDIINGYDQAFLDASPMTEMLLQDNAVQDSPTATKLRATQPSIEFAAVSYKYSDSNDNVIQKLSLTIPAGQKIGLVGHSGAGKTTIVQLLLRFSDTTEGRILIADQDIRSVTQTSLREHIAYVPQEPLLFHRSLRENIAYGKTDANDEQIRDAAQKANALEFIQRLPHGFDTLVGERGVKLSGGQRQRVAIARAILKDAPILILDEATSALDSESEKLIQDALEKLMKGRTSIVIAHRLSTIAKLDRIIVLDNGQIAEDGTHAELLKHKGIYAKLWSHQSGGFIEE